MLASLISLASTSFSQLQTNPASGPDATRHVEITNSSDAEGFADLVRDDFFAGDDASLKRAMKLCEDALAKNPTNAPVMSWQGTGWLRLAGKSYQAGDYTNGAILWQRGLKEINDAVALQPDSLHVLIPRAAAFQSVAKHVPDPAESKAMLTTAVTDYEKVLKLQRDDFKSLSLHSRGELLSALAEDWYVLGQTNKSVEYLLLITNECAGSTYSKNAGSWLESIAAKTQNNPKTLTCIGCHNR